jgi:hypothetical protein
MKTIWPTAIQSVLNTGTRQVAFCAGCAGSAKAAVVLVKALMPFVPGEPGTLTAGTDGQGVQQSDKMLIRLYF